MKEPPCESRSYGVTRRVNRPKWLQVYAVHNGELNLNTNAAHTASHARKMAPKRAAPRFTESELGRLLDAVEERRAIIYPRDGRRPRGQAGNVAWEAVAAAVNARALTQRTSAQCRKKMNDLVRAAREKMAHNRREREKIGGGVPELRLLTEFEECALELSGEAEDITGTDNQVDVQNGRNDHNEAGPSGVVAPPTAAPAETSEGSSEHSLEESTEESFEETTQQSPKASLSESTSTVTVTMVGHVSGETPGSLSGAHSTTAHVHHVEMGRSKDSGAQRSAGAKETAGPQPGAGLLGSVLPKLFEMQTQSRRLQEGMSVTFQQLQDLLEESHSLQVQEVVPALRGTQANIARVASAVESLGQEMVAMGGRVQGMAESLRSMTEGPGSMLETQRVMVAGFESLSQSQRAMAEGLQSLAQSQRALAEGIQSLSQSQRATAEGIQSLVPTQRAIAEGLHTMGLTQLGFQDWQSQVMQRPLELTPAALPPHGVSQGPNGSPRYEGALEPMQGPSARDTLVVTRTSESPLPDTGASLRQRAEHGGTATSVTPETRPGPSRSRPSRGRPPRATRGVEHS
ncbi:uncharacterized protein LOC144497873 [Mustelus asterias]